MNIAELKELIRTEPGVRATFDEINGEFQKAAALAESLGQRLNELNRKLHAIADAKEMVVELLTAPTEDPTDLENENT